jgi:hypothetical protein
MSARENADGRRRGDRAVTYAPQVDPYEHHANSGRVEHVKSQLKARLLLILDGTTAAIAEDIGRQLVTSGQ